MSNGAGREAPWVVQRLAPLHREDARGSKSRRRLIADRTVWPASVVVDPPSFDDPLPAPEVFVPALAAWPSARPQTAPTAMLPLAPKPPLN